MEELEILLSSLPKEEREDVLRYYDSYFEDAGVEYEQVVIKELGSAGRVAAQILREFRQEKSEGIYTERGYQEREEKKETPIRYEARQEETKANTNNYGRTTNKEVKNDSQWYQSKKKLSKSSSILLFILIYFATDFECRVGTIFCSLIHI